MTPYYNGIHIPCPSVFCLASGAYSGNFVFLSNLHSPNLSQY